MTSDHPDPSHTVPVDRGVFDALREAVVVVDREGRVVDANRSAVRMFAVQTTDLVSATMDGENWHAIDGDGRFLPPHRLPAAGVLRDGRPRLGVVIGICIHEAPPRWVSVNSVPLRDAVGDVERVVSTMSDITELRRAHEEARRSEQLFAAAFSHAPIGMGLVTPGGGWLRVNPALVCLFGMPEAALLRRTFHDLVHPDDVAASRGLLDAALQDGGSSHAGPVRYVRPTGELLHANLSVSLVRDNAGAPLHLVAQVEDQTDQRVLTDRLERLALTDELTGLANRRRFVDALGHRLRAGVDGWWVCIVDLDHLKRFNDTRGHAAGDALLRQTADACCGQLLEDDLAARLGGDEFALLLHRDATDGDAVAQSVMSGLTGAGVATSVGAASLAVARNASAVLSAADAAMYRTKLARRVARRS